MSHLHLRQVQVLRGVAPWFRCGLHPTQPVAPRRSNLLALLLILTSCAPVQTSQSVTTVPLTTFQPIPTSTSTPIVPTPTITQPEPTPIPCDPFNEDFCIIEGHFILQRPIKPPANDLADQTYPYGSTANGTRDPHHGVEFENSSGTPVYAAVGGEVVFAGADAEAIYSPWKNYYGNLIVISHMNEVFTLYAHLSKIDIEAGQEVQAGEQIGEVGSTGTAMGSHLHFEVRQAEVQDYFATQNPELWLAPKEDEGGGLMGALMISVVDQNLVFQDAGFTVGYYLARNQAPAKVYYVTTYAPDLMTGEENAALGNLSAGEYRIALTHSGQLYERWVEVKSGKLTQVVIVVK